ncbi:molybdenum cofactor biosynthesis protein MoaE [Thermococcus profundus]|uniref:molybdopterin synthase n=1 Tax=Thermococcus profundus TaxID=49899 RepID=A0A2Z2M6Z4_THEPR|nr:molybdenum cofactor biosynthesis protein MoaE [Thermococcus profundus]ASJ01937.1 molybdenum cofactor biosynthesis protein MoaE [Thermococcus profundus]
MELKKVMVLEGPFNIEKAVELVSVPEAGGYVVFLGKVRNENRGRKVRKLIYEAYREMAEEEMERIRKEALERFPILDILIWHRVGELEVGEDTILVIAGGKHRGEAFDACRWAVDEVKHRVPVWKKEVTDEGAFWIEGDRLVPEGYHRT